MALVAKLLLRNPKALSMNETDTPGMTDSARNWPDAVDHGFGFLSGAPEAVQMTATIGIVVIALAGILAWWLSSRRKTDDGLVPASVLISVTEEFSRQVGHLASVVEKLEETMRDCSSCAFRRHDLGKE
jgi:hypothetical protein